MSRQDGQFRSLSQFRWSQRNSFLKPTDAQAMINQAQLERAALALDTNFQRRNQAYQESVAQKSKIVVHALPPDRYAESMRSFFRQSYGSGGLTGITARQSENLFQ